MPIISSTKAEEAEQTADLFSEHTRSCTAEGEPGEENGPNAPGGYCQEWGVLWWNHFKGKKKIGEKEKYVEIALWWKKIKWIKLVIKLINSNSVKTNLPMFWHNLQIQNVMKLITEIVTKLKI